MSNSKKPIPYSPSLQSSNLVFISGQVGIDPKTAQLSNASFESEVRQVMENLKARLAEHCLILEDLVSTIIYLKDMTQYQELNEIYGSYFSNRFPTRTCIAVTDLPVGASVEISGVAEIKPKKSLKK